MADLLSVAVLTGWYSNFLFCAHVKHFGY